MTAAPADLGTEVPADEWTATPDPECVAVGCGGCIDHLNEYPCNCFSCRGRLSAVSEAHGDCYHDGELTWWRCDFCRRYFDLEDMEILSGDGQACEPCVSGWERRLRERQRPGAGSRLDVDDENTRPAPGVASLS